MEGQYYKVVRNGVEYKYKVITDLHNGYVKLELLQSTNNNYTTPAFGTILKHAEVINTNTLVIHSATLDIAYKCS